MSTVIGAPLFTSHAAEACAHGINLEKCRPLLCKPWDFFAVLEGVCIKGFRKEVQDWVDTLGFKVWGLQNLQRCEVQG